MDDVGFVLGGRIGREFFGAIYALLFVALVGSGLVAVSIALNAVSLHAMCTVGWVAIVRSLPILYRLSILTSLNHVLQAAIITFSLASIQTLNKVSAIGWVGLVSVISAIMVIVIAVSVQDRPAAAPATGAVRISSLLLQALLNKHATAFRPSRDLSLFLSGTRRSWPSTARRRSSAQWGLSRPLSSPTAVRLRECSHLSIPIV